MKRIVSQECREHGVFTVFEDGTSEMRDYEIDENGDSYIDLFPNDESDALSN